jgi:putative ABC transport system ATP-binding protein
MIVLSRATKVYRAEAVETVALNRVSLSIAAGEFVAVMGPSGCGKSTLLNVLGMIDALDEGSYRFEGEEIARRPERELVRLRRQRLGFVFQSFNLIEELTVFQNVELPLHYNHMPAAERRDRVREVLELVGLSHRARHRPAQLSGGQQQRVAIARAVAAEPMLILADEPTGNLDRKSGTEIMELLATLNEQGSTIVMVTHSPTDAAFAHRIVEMVDGGVVAGVRAPEAVA